MNLDRGLLYVATGQPHASECRRSARSAKARMPDLPISVWTDRPNGFVTGCFDSVHVLKDRTHSYLDKIIPLERTDFAKTIFVDTDTFFLHPVHDVFELLDHFELAYTHEVWRIHYWKEPVADPIPPCFPEINTGVFAYRRSPRVFRFFRKWLQIYRDQLGADVPPDHDQPAFRQALYDSDLRSVVLPPEYNSRSSYPMFKGGGCPVKILHGRDPSLTRAIKGVNRHDGIRLYDFSQDAPPPPRPNP